MGSVMGQGMGQQLGPNWSATEILDGFNVGAEASEILDRFNVVKRRFA